MRRFKNLTACISCLKRWQADESLDLGQKEALQHVIRKLRKLSQHSKPDREDVFELVRQLSETLWKVFSKQ